MRVAPRRTKQSVQRRDSRDAAHRELKPSVWNDANQAVNLFRSSVSERVNIVRDGVPARYVIVLATDMGIAKEKFYRTIGLMRPTIDRKVRAATLLNQDESERVMGIARLVGQAESIVHDSGGTDKFEAAKWVAAWLDRPLAALGDKRPGEYMDTADGRTLVADLLAQQQSGAYA
jgi:putative toxin-antitoxin system antitoxin component (TIGR02293 family)